MTQLAKPVELQQGIKNSVCQLKGNGPRNSRIIMSILPNALKKDVEGTKALFSRLIMCYFHLGLIVSQAANYFIDGSSSHN